MSAGAFAVFERPAPHAGVRPPPDIAARLAAVRTGAHERAMPDVWSQMDMTVRIVLVMIACGQMGQPERIARQPWDSFSATDQLAMASAARLIVSSLETFAAVA